MTSEAMRSFTWNPNVQVGEWIDAREETPVPALAWLIPPGFDTLVRVFHPFERDKPKGATWAEFHRLQHEQQWHIAPPIVREPVRWDALAELAGRSRDAHASSRDLLVDSGFEDFDDLANSHKVIDGWRYSEPGVGSLDHTVLQSVARVLERYTADPDPIHVAVWEGYGWESGMHVALAAGEDETGDASSTDERERIAWQRGRTHALTWEMLTGPKLQLPQRAYLCFLAALRAFTTEEWIARAPWSSQIITSDHAQSPNLMWPPGREWLLVTEIDFDSTLIACSAACAEDLVNSSDIEAVRITRNTPNDVFMYRF